MLQYGSTEGLSTLRQILLQHFADLDNTTPQQLNVTADDIVISTGSQQLLYILTDILIDPGDIVITEWPSYFVYTGVLTSASANVRCVEMDDQGLIPEKLDQLLASLKKSGDLHRVKMLYTCDYHQNPTGITLSNERRPLILDIIKKYSTDHRILILEDAAYRELTYRGDIPNSIKSYDHANQFVALVQTFSKPFAPGFKTGYAMLPTNLVSHVVKQKGSHDFGSANLTQYLLLKAMQTGIYSKHVAQLRKSYDLKLNAMLDALQNNLSDLSPDKVKWTNPSGGLYVYLTLPPNINTSRDTPFFDLAIKNGVLYVAGEYCFSPDITRTIPQNTIRLSFGVSTVDQIHQGISRLANTIKTSL